MAIVPLKKMTLCGRLDDKASVLEKLQELGGAHLISLTRLQAASEQASEQQVKVAADALKYLLQCRKKRHQVQDVRQFNVTEVVEQVSKVRAESRRLSDLRDFLQKRIKEVTPWGDFCLPDKGSLGSIRLWFYIIPLRMMDRLDKSLIHEIVHRDNIHCYVVVLSEEEPPPPAVPVPRTHTGAVPLSQLRRQLEQTELQREDCYAERESLTRWITLLSLSLVRHEEAIDLQRARTMTLDRDPVFVLQAWIPESEVSRFSRFADKQGLVLMVMNPGDNDRPPTLLSNPGHLAGGEDVVGFYQTPGYRDWDPSVVVFFSFALFFAMILSDAGYAGLFMLILAFSWQPLGRSAKGRRLRMLSLITLALSLVWGMLLGSYFGMAPDKASLLASVKLFDMQDFSSMMRLSISVGAAHIALANVVSAWQKRGKLTALASIGWAMVVCAGYFYWLTMHSGMVRAQQAAIMILVTGLLLVLLFGSDKAVSRPVDFFWRMLEGIRNLTGITRIFGDVLSYMRLFALGLASASLALTFNHLAGHVYHTVSGVGLLLSLLILLLGHSLNLLLCLMSGLVHGLRLNFIEFYNWSVSDEGYPFKSFSKRSD